MLPNMLANILAVLAVVLLATSTARANLMYKSVSYKGNRPRSMLNDEMRFSIPDGQCSGAIDKALLCPMMPTIAVEVTALDREPFPMIHIDPRFDFAEVQRAPDAQGLCGGSSDVIIRTACRVLPRLRRSLASNVLPPAHHMQH